MEYPNFSYFDKRAGGKIRRTLNERTLQFDLTIVAIVAEFRLQF